MNVNMYFQPTIAIATLDRPKLALLHELLKMFTDSDYSVLKSLVDQFLKGFTIEGIFRRLVFLVVCMREVKYTQNECLILDESNFMDNKLVPGCSLFFKRDRVFANGVVGGNFLCRIVVVLKYAQLGTKAQIDELLATEISSDLVSSHICHCSTCLHFNVDKLSMMHIQFEHRLINNDQRALCRSTQRGPNGEVLDCKCPTRCNDDLKMLQEKDN